MRAARATIPPTLFKVYTGSVLVRELLKKLVQAKRGRFLYFGFHGCLPVSEVVIIGQRLWLVKYIVPQFFAFDFEKRLAPRPAAKEPAAQIDVADALHGVVLENRFY